VGKKQRKRKQAGHSRQEQSGKAVRVLTYEITSEPIHDQAYHRLPVEVRDAISDLNTLAQTKPSSLSERQLSGLG